MKAWVAGLVVAALAGTAWGQQEVKLAPVSGGMMHRMGGYVPQAVELSVRPPGTLRVTPAGLRNPLYGVLPLGDGKSGRVFHVVLDGDSADGPRSRLWVDTNGNGDMTDDGPAEWKGKPSRGEDGKVYEDYSGQVTVDLGPAGRPFVATLGVYNFDPRTPGMEPKYKTMLAYYRDYGREGVATFGAEKLKVMLEDQFTTGDLSGRTRPQKPFEDRPPLWLFVDRNGNGRVDGDAEFFDAAEPFAINGVTYEVRDVGAAGEAMTLVESKRVVKELPVPADVRVGKVVPAFEGVTVDGKRVRVPGDFKGKVVLVDFWATWCGVCLAEMPNLGREYGKYHRRGLEVVGVSVDEAADREKVVETIRERGVSWPTVFEGKGQDAELVTRLGVSGFPTTLLIDGDTGVLLARDHDLRGEQLGPTVEREMRKKGLLPANGGGK